MKNLILYLALFTTFNLSAQTKKVLFEEFTGTGCGTCPGGHQIMDDLLTAYPNLIGIGLHTYNASDAMFFPEIDPLYTSYAAGAPMATADRVYSGTGFVADVSTNWESNVQTRLAESPKVSVSLDVAWNSSTRLISTEISTEIFENLPTGDYRFNFYVVEDSVTGVGVGYDQTNFYNTSVGSPFFGLGNPIPEYVHMHVARAILPSTWGQSGIISSTPLVGEIFTTTIDYTLPISYDEEQVRLVAFVSKYTTDHLGDEVYNAEEATLIDASLGIKNIASESDFEVYPNPVQDLIIVESEYKIEEIQIVDMLGKTLLVENTAKIDVSHLPNGSYILIGYTSNGVFHKQFIKQD